MRDFEPLIEAYLDTLRQVGRSSPGGRYWDAAYRLIVNGIPKEYWPSHPLILGGSIATDKDKHQRLREHLKFAAENGRLFELLAKLETLTDDCWNAAAPSTWGDEHPWIEEWKET